MYLGMQIIKMEDGSYSFCQQYYLATLLKEFKMADCKPSPTSIIKAQTNALVEGNYGRKLLDKKHHHLYRQIVGKLIYAMVGSRLDLVYSLSVLSRYAFFFISGLLGILQLA